MTHPNFWDHLEALMNTSKLVIDVQRGSVNDFYPFGPYTFDYGHLENTSSMDNEGIDIFLGSSLDKTINGIICTVDLLKKDSEIKILYSCTEFEINEIDTLYQHYPSMRGLLVRRN
ncbi:inorganic pyrophosphatase [Candidatus Bathyarchaeota archaeon]|nr:inorganic pyrophosphatase [Candidatus Bathyarchaeota archaeon]